MNVMTRGTRIAALAISLALVPAVAASAATPDVTTRNATQITATGALLRGYVDPNGEATRYYFEYGPTRTYGSRTGDAGAGSGNSRRAVSTRVSGLRPNTVYNVRIVASNRSGVRSGANVQFRTARQPLGLTLSATPNPVVFGSATTLAGQLTGTGSAGRQIVLQQRGFPYTSAFADVGNPIVTDAAGNFSLPQTLVPLTTQFRVRTATGQRVTSDVATVSVARRVATSVTATRVKRGRLLGFSGTIRPARAGSRFAVQKLASNGRWVVVAGGIARSATSEYSTYSRRVRVPRGGSYRIYVESLDGRYISNVGRTVRIRSYK
jgi:hypothetical protein